MKGGGRKGRARGGGAGGVSRSDRGWSGCTPLHCTTLLFVDFN